MRMRTILLLMKMISLSMTVMQNSKTFWIHDLFVDVMFRIHQQLSKKINYRTTWSRRQVREAANLRTARLAKEPKPNMKMRMRITVMKTMQMRSTRRTFKIPRKVKIISLMRANKRMSNLRRNLRLGTDSEAEESVKRLAGKRCFTSNSREVARICQK